MIFPGRNAGASLKLLRPILEGAPVWHLPRQKCRGLIEATNTAECSATASHIFPVRNAGASLEYPWRGGPRLKATTAIFRPQFHSPRHLFHQLTLHRSTRKPIQINALNLVRKIDQPSSFGENPPIRREKARPFRSRTIKVSSAKPANTREFPSPPRAESMFA